MDKAVARTSRMPIWVCVIVGALIGLSGGVNFVVAVTLGFVLGYVLYARNLALSENAQLHSRIGAMLERVSLLEYSVKRLRTEPQEAAEMAPGVSIETPPNGSTETAPVAASPPAPEPQQQVPTRGSVTPASAPQAHAPWIHPNAIARPRVFRRKKLVRLSSIRRSMPPKRGCSVATRWRGSGCWSFSSASRSCFAM